MTNLITKLKSAVSNIALFGVTIVMAGLGFALMGTLAMFALVAMGVALIAAPFLQSSQPCGNDAETAA